MENPDDIMEFTHMIEHFREMEETLDVLSAEKDDHHIFEVYVEDFTLEFDEKLEKHLDIHDTLITRERTIGDNAPYYKVVIRGLIG